MPACITFDALEAGYERPVVGPVSFAVDAGEVVALWGDNGSGKTTLLNTAAGAVRIFGGRLVKRPGLRVSHQQQQALPIAGIPLSGRELFALTGATPDHLPAPLVPLLDRRLSELSGGQLQLLQVFACLRAPADLVLLDEPTNNVDPGSVTLLVDALRNARGGRAVLFVSHDRRFVDAVADRVIEVGAP
jgi:ATPase subunit of ABC transporter with duplicated ATPase domains